MYGNKEIFESKIKEIRHKTKKFYLKTTNKLQNVWKFYVHFVNLHRFC